MFACKAACDCVLHFPRGGRAPQHQPVARFLPREHPAIPPSIQKLTPRERQILTFIARGLTSKEIASHLGISHRTVENYRKRIGDKTDTHTLAGIIRLAIMAGLD
jgi:FixJ family two-component response regulator